MAVAQKLLGRRLFEAVMKGTFYGHFVAGESKEEIKPKIDMMEKFGVGAILDYAVEADMPDSSTNFVSKYDLPIFCISIFCATLGLRWTSSKWALIIFSKSF